MRAGQTVYLSGVTGMDSGGHLVGTDDPVSQIEQAFSNFAVSLASVGADWSNLVRWTVYLTHARYLEAWQQVRSAHIAKENRPAGTLLIVAGLAVQEMIVEIDGIALIDL